jgi:hypothetical protein
MRSPRVCRPPLRPPIVQVYVAPQGSLLRRRRHTVKRARDAVCFYLPRKLRGRAQRRGHSPRKDPLDVESNAPQANGPDLRGLHSRIRPASQPRRKLTCSISLSTLIRAIQNGHFQVRPSGLHHHCSEYALRQYRHPPNGSWVRSTRRGRGIASRRGVILPLERRSARGSKVTSRQGAPKAP